jgi:triosephosphate isomerase
MVIRDEGATRIRAQRVVDEDSGAYSGPIRPLILIEIGHPFWFKPATDSG